MKAPEHDLLAALRELYGRRQDEVVSTWNRVLPLGDLVVDRWEKAKTAGFAERASIYDSAIVFGSVSVGEATWVGPHVILDGSGRLKIGSHCSISAGVQIYTHDSVRWALSGGHAMYEHAPVIIGNHTYIGPNSIVTKGVTIGNCCLIGANSLVNKNIPDNSIAFGSACRIVGKVIVADSGDIELRYDE